MHYDTKAGTKYYANLVKPLGFGFGFHAWHLEGCFGPEQYQLEIHFLFWNLILGIECAIPEDVAAQWRRKQ
jgi:hypothetical protein